MIDYNVSMNKRGKYMRGSWIAGQIESDLKREKFWKHKIVRQKCYVDKEKQCDKCMYKNICDDVEESNSKE